MVMVIIHQVCMELLACGLRSTNMHQSLAETEHVETHGVAR
jgi:hypothetical protein